MCENQPVIESIHGHLVFASGSTLIAVSAEHAAEIVSLPRLTRVPGAADHIEGVFAHRGEVMPVLDFERLLGVPVNSTVATRVVLLQLKNGSMGISSTKVFGICALEGDLKQVADSGVRSFMFGPLVAPVGEVLHVDVVGLFDYLAAGGR